MQNTLNEKDPKVLTLLGSFLKNEQEEVIYCNLFEIGSYIFIDAVVLHEKQFRGSFMTTPLLNEFMNCAPLSLAGFYYSL